MGVFDYNLYLVFGGVPFFFFKISYMHITSHSGDGRNGRHEGPP